MSSVNVASPEVQAGSKISKYAYIVLLTTFLGWAMDAMDSSFFSLVLKPAVTELLGGNASPTQLGSYGGTVMSTYLIGWATGGIVFGLLTDYLGRVRMLTIGILMYSLFTGLCAIATSIPMLAVFRFLTGLGSGPEFAIGAAMITEIWGSRHRAKAIGVMMSGFSFGYFLAAFLYYFIGQWGWRPVFLVGILPALLIIFIRRHLEEPKRWQEVQERRAELRRTGAVATEFDKEMNTFTLKQVFVGPYLKLTILNILIATAALVGNWAVGAWIPTIVNLMLTKEGIATALIVKKVSIVSMAYNGGGFLGYATWGFIADKWGRKPAFIMSFIGASIMAPVLFLGAQNYSQYLLLSPLLGYFIFGSFAGLAIYMAEVYPTHVRGTGSTFCLNISRYLVALAPMWTGVLVSALGGFAMAATVLSTSFLIGFIASLLIKETKGMEIS
ncbi:MAG: MFS transporter [Eubacteriales bacterium]